MTCDAGSKPIAIAMPSRQARSSRLASHTDAPPCTVTELLVQRLQDAIVEEEEEEAPATTTTASLPPLASPQQPPAAAPVPNRPATPIPTRPLAPVPRMPLQDVRNKLANPSPALALIKQAPRAFKPAARPLGTGNLTSGKALQVARDDGVAGSGP
jgi:hypothetical protein